MLGDDDPETSDWEVEAGMVGVVAQDYPLFSHITVIDNLMVAARLKIENKKEARATCMKYLTDFKLEDAATKYPHEISGGMRQRVAIIQQVISCGHLLLMDEPFSGLDPLRKEDVQNLILNISMAHELNTIILTTHDIHAAIQVCDTITLLGRERNGDGHIIQGAKVAATYNLVERGLAWRPKITEMIQFRDLEREIVAKFHEL